MSYSKSSRKFSIRLFCAHALHLWRPISQCAEPAEPDILAPQILGLIKWNSGLVKQDWLIASQKFAVFISIVITIQYVCMSRPNRILTLKVRQSPNHFFKPMCPPKNKRKNFTLLLLNLRSTCFHSFFGGIWRHQKDISKIPDLSQVQKSLFLVMSASKNQSKFECWPIWKQRYI